MKRVVKFQKSGSNTRIEISTVFVDLWRDMGFAIEKGDPCEVAFENGKLIVEPLPMKTANKIGCLTERIAAPPFPACEAGRSA